MKNNYRDLINQTYAFPQAGFDIQDGHLTFHGVGLKQLIKKYNTPFKLMYLPRIGEQITRSRKLFEKAILKHEYKGKYYYAYCTKCCHYAQVVKAATRNGVQLETSSSLDVDLIYKLYTDNEIDKSITIIHNGYKTDDYLQKIIQLKVDGFENSILILDSKKELQRVLSMTDELDITLKIGIRMAINEEPQKAYYTSRMGIPPDEIIRFYQSEIKDNPKVEMSMFHFFVDSGIKDNLYYWGEFRKALNLFVELKILCPNLNAFNIGGGFPIKNNLGIEFDYEYIIDEIVSNIKTACNEADISEPDLFTEFGKYTVGESGAIIFSVLEQKQQNDAEMWYMVDNSLMNTIPDAWSIYEKFILLPINKWDNEYGRVNIGGISCDHADYYNSEDLNQQIFLPKYSNEEEPLYIGFFHTGAYQDAISGYGGIKHCLIPAPKLIIVDEDEDGNQIDYVYQTDLSIAEKLETLGY